MYEKFTERARNVIRLADEIAKQYFHEYIGTEHILLGLIKENSGVGIQILQNLNADPQELQAAVEELIEPCPETVSMGKLPQTPRAKRVIEFAFEEWRELEHQYLDTEHILLGLIREQEGYAAHVLERFGVTREKARAELIRLREEESGKSKAPEDPPSLNMIRQNSLEMIEKLAKDYAQSKNPTPEETSLFAGMISLMQYTLQRVDDMLQARKQ